MPCIIKVVNSMSKVGLGAIVVAFRSRPIITKCLSSLRDSGVTEAVVIENVSSDPSCEEISASFWFKYLSQQPNLGFAAAANRAAHHLSSETLFFLNPDAHVLPHSLAQAAHYLSAHPDVGIVGLSLYSPEGQLEKSWGNDVTPLSLFTRKLNFFSQAPVRPQSVGWVSGAAFLIRRQTFFEVGGFDPQFFLYWEDVDLCRRVRQVGKKIVFLPNARVIHHKGSSLTDKHLKTNLFDQSADRYCHKYYSKPICYLLWQARRFYRFFWPQVA